MNGNKEECIQAAMEAAEACDMCASSCLSEKDTNTLRRCIRLNMDCAEICLETARLVRRDSESQPEICRLCAEICDRCAAECRRHQDMEHCRICATACDTCADACRALAEALVVV